MRGRRPARRSRSPASTQRGSLPSTSASILLVLVLVPGAALLLPRPLAGRLPALGHPGAGLVGSMIIVAAVLGRAPRGGCARCMLVGVTGYGTAMLFLLHGAPDLALTQVLVETVDASWSSCWCCAGCPSTSPTGRCAAAAGARLAIGARRSAVVACRRR